MPALCRELLRVGAWVLSSSLVAAELPGQRPPGTGEAWGPRELVVLVHGMGRTRHSMCALARALERAGYETLNYGYHSRRSGVDDHGDELTHRLAAAESRPEVTRIHLVGHSLGNIVIRSALVKRPLTKMGRVVMLAPPNQGARMADLSAGWLSWISRPLPDLTTSAASAARTIPAPPGVQIGVIAGSRDFMVRIPETRLDGQADQVVVSSGHTFIMRKRSAQEMTIRFLKTGSFAAEDEGGGEGADSAAVRR